MKDAPSSQSEQDADVEAGGMDRDRDQRQKTKRAKKQGEKAKPEAPVPSGKPAVCPEGWADCPVTWWTPPSVPCADFSPERYSTPDTKSLGSETSSRAYRREWYKDEPSQAC